jgi:hypothetical protein
VGVRGVSVTYGPRRDSTYVQIWFSRVNDSAANHAGIEVLESHAEEVRTSLSGYSLDWRKNASTTILEVIVDGIGYETEFHLDRAQAVASVASKMKALVQLHKSEIIDAMDVASAGPDAF